MAGFDFTPAQEAALQRELDEKEQRRAKSKASLPPALASNINDFQRRFPYAQKDVLVASAQAFTDGKMSREQVEKLIDDLTLKEIERQAAEAESRKKKSWWERNVSSKIRTGSRWTMAALNFVPEGIQNLAAMSAQAGRTVRREGWDEFFDAWDTDGFVISTSLGSLLENDKAAGDGYFVGGETEKMQADRARRFRGTVNGQAFTMGRYLANTISQPGSKEYRYVSGLVDAAAAILTPSVPGGKAVTGAVKGAAGSAGARVGLRSLAGLTDYESALIIPEKVNDFLNTRAGRAAVRRLVNTNTVDEALEIFPTADVTFLKNVASTTDEVAMNQLLRDTLGLGDPTRGVGPTSVNDINIGRWDNVKTSIVQRENLVARMMSKVPGRHVVIAGGSEREKTQALKNVKNYLKLLRVDPDERARIVEGFADAFVNDDGSMKLVVEQTQQVMRLAFKNMGVSDDVAEELIGNLGKFIDDYQKDLYGALNDVGDAADFGGKFTAVVDGNVVTVNQPLGTAGLQSEMLRHGFMLPDPRVIRRLASNIGWITGKSTGDARFPLSLIDWIQNEVWRPFTLMTGGYVLRNMGDSLLRASFAPGVRSGVFHPLEWIMTAAFKRYRGDIAGGSFKGDAETLLRNDQSELAEAAQGTVRESMDPVKRTARERATGVWTRVKVGDGKNEYMKGVAAELSLLASDDVARMVAAGDDVDTIVQTLTSDKNLTYIKNLQNRWKNRILDDGTGNKVVGTVRFIDDSGVVDEANLRTFINQYIIPRIEETTGGSTVLKEIIATGAYTDSTGNVIDVLRFNAAGRISGYDDELWRTISDAIDDPNVKLRETYKMQQEVYPAEPGGLFGQARSRVMQSMDRAVDKFFSELYPKREAWLNRSPVFRQFYYGSIGRLLNQMSEQEVGRLVDNLIQVAAQEGKTFGNNRTARIWVGKYLGDAALADRMFDIKAGKLTTGGKLTVEQIDAYAKGFALDETKRLFYNAAEKSNFADILRIVAPFGTAWAEVTKRWVKALATEPETLKRFGVTVEGLIDADPDGDGKGFFYKDPQSGEYVFNYPFSEQLAPLIMGLGGAVTGGIGFGLPGLVVGGAAGAGAGVVTQQALEGVQPTFAAPVKSLSMGLTIIPGVGPYVQLAASKIIGDRPDVSLFGAVTINTDTIKRTISPYGAPDVSFLTMPSWADKMWQAVTADPEKDRIYGDLKVDVMRALVATGSYDTATPEGRQQLDKDSSQKARVLLMLRALGQFTGPTRPSTEFKLDTKQGDMYSSEASKLFYDLQAQNYDTAPEKFLEIMGEDFFTYIASKTRAVEGGLDASQEFGDWQNRNKDFFERHPDIAGYFAPVGSTFDYQVYVRQIESGGRQRLTAAEVLEEAQARVGTALYRSLVREVGPNRTEEQDAILREAREYLGARYTGFRDKVLDVKATERRINQLYDAVNDKALNNNPVARALREYFQIRDEAVAIAQSRGTVGLGGKTNADLRAILLQAGEDYSLAVPEFARLWERILYNEVDV